MNWFSQCSIALLGVTLAHSQVVVNAAFEEGRPLSPNSIAVAFGDFVGATPATASTVPIPNQLGGVEVTVEGLRASIYSVSRTQVNFVVPAGLEAGVYARRVPIQVRINGTLLPGPLTALIRDVSPAVLLRDATNALRPATATNADGALNGEGRPARQGDGITLYATGCPQRDVDRGTRTLVFFRTWVGETPVSSAPDSEPGLSRISVRIPPMVGAPSGATPVAVVCEGVQSNTATVWVQ